MATIPIQLSETDLEKIDHLILIGKYKNRSQAVKSMLQSKLEQEKVPSEWDTPADKENRQKIISQILQNKHFKIEILSIKNAVDLVRENRDR